MRLFVLVLLLVSTSSLAGCGESGESPGDNQTVVAAFYPLAWAAERAGDESVTVQNLTPAGAEPHDIELSPRDVEQIRHADLVLYVGGGFQPAVEEAVKDRDGPSLDVLPRGETDPHVWLDPVRFAGIVERVAQKLGRAGSVRGVIRRLRRLDADYRNGLARCQRRTLVTTHAAFGQLAARYDLIQLSLTGRSPEAEPSPRELERLIDQVRDSGATTVFRESLVSSRLANTVARETGVEVAVLDPIEGLSEDRLGAGEDYISVMRTNLDILEDALGCQ